MRRVMVFVLLLLLCAAPAAAFGIPIVVIDGAPLILPPDQQPFIEQDRTLVPLRAIFEALGASVEWEGPTQTVTAAQGVTTIRLTIGSATAYVGDRSVTLDVPAKLVGERTYVPLRFVSEAFGARVQWLGESSTVLITTVPGELERVSVGASQVLKPEGESIYFLDLKTGEVEGFTVPGAAAFAVSYTASADGRFVIARSKSTVWTADRVTGTVHRWDVSHHDLVTAGGGRLLFHEVGTGRYKVLDSDLQPIITFELPGDGERVTPADRALFSPDGQRLAIARGESAYLVDLATGRKESIAMLGTRFQPVKGGAEFIAFTETPKGLSLRRYTWQGEVQAQALIEARRVHVSDDGEWVAWEVVRDQFTPAVYYAPLSSAHNPFQALGTTMCYGFGGSSARWLGQEHQLVVRTKDGMRMLTTSGEARPLPMAGSYPAPGGADLLAFHRWEQDAYRVGAVDRNGEVAVEVTVVGKQGLMPSLRSASWGASAAELQFTVETHVGGGAPCGEYAIPLSLKVGAPGTFDWHLGLQVKGTGSCLNVRSGPSLDSEPIACLNDGTRIELGNNAAWDTIPSLYQSDGQQWFEITLDSGAKGWIMVSSGYVDWAD